VDVVSQIVTMPLDERTGRAKSGMTSLISGEAYDMDPALSPDGSELVFVSSGRWPGFQRVFRANIRKGTLAPLSEAAGVSESNPLFSPDGKWLVFERDRNDSKGELLLLPREGGAPRRIAVGAEKSVAVWYPDSRRVLFQASAEGKAVFDAASIEGGPATRVLSENYDTMHPAISPDGNWLAFAGNRDGEFDVFLRPLQGGAVVPRGKTALRDGHPFFSNDSKWLYFQPGHQNVFRVPVSGGEIEPVTSESTHNLYLDAPRLTPDGSAILLSRCLFHANVWVLDLGAVER
jgi:TolB protein